jgi:hypothetical protein
MQFAKRKMVQAHARVFLNIMEIRTPFADQNALKILIAIVLKPVSMKNVKTHVLEFVEIMLFATLLIIHRSASVYQVLQETR